MDDVRINDRSYQQEAERMNFFQRLAGVMVSPEKVMRNLAAKPRVLFPILMMILAPAGFVYGRLPLFQQTMREAILMGMKQQPNVEITPELIEITVGMMPRIVAIGMPVMLLLCWIILNAILLGIVKLMGGQARYKQLLSVTGYAMVIALLQFIIIFAVSFFSGNLNLTFSPALFITDVQGSYFLAFLKSLLGSLDIFSIWVLIVTCTGIIAVSGLSRKKVYYVMFGIYAVFALIGAFMAGSSALIM